MKSKSLITWLAIVCVGLLCVVSPNRAVTQDIKAGASPPWSTGNPNAAVVIEVFNDYQCPPCGMFNEELKKVQILYGDRVRIVFRNFPLPQTHQNALAAASIAEAAGMQGKFVEMINLLYDQRHKWAEAKSANKLFSSYAQTLGLDVEKIEHDAASDEVGMRIRLDVERARSLNVMGTPTVFLNGERVRFELLPNFDRTIEKTLRGEKP
jgi:protein-disulfide isomerase